MIRDCNAHPENNVKNNEKTIYIYVCMYVCMYVCIYIYMYVCMYVCIINVTKMVFVETVLTVSDCIMIVRFGIVWNGLDGFIL